MDYLVCALVMGVGATVLVDLWAIARRWLFGVSPPNYGLVGRWFAHLARGRFRHESIASSSAVRGERVIGWVAHYVVGVLFAALLGVWLLKERFGAQRAAGTLVIVGGVMALRMG